MGLFIHYIHIAKISENKCSKNNYGKRDDFRKEKLMVWNEQVELSQDKTSVI